SNLAVVDVDAAVGNEPSVAFNRRFFMDDGSVAWNPGKLNPRIVGPAGGIDPELGVVRFKTPGMGTAPGKIAALFLNFAVHLDNVGGAKISADVPGVIARRMEEVYGKGVTTLYATGCCGDVNHIDVKWGERQGGPENAARMGTILAAEALRTFPKLKPVQGTGLQVRRAIVKLPLAEVTSEQERKARDTVKRLQEKSKPAPAFAEQVDAFKTLDVLERRGKPWEVEVQTMTLGRSLAWVSLPGEIFVELGQMVKRESPYAVTMPVELANGAIGYIPSRRAYPQGAYEVISARCAAGSGEMLVEAAGKLLRESYGTKRIAGNGQ
ncbi:MAG TPA: hypothetical protein VNC50_08425, partial [Planctomycetia bacterium]|nr:hypothetical protein [Planctomycetia bacterium]